MVKHYLITVDLFEPARLHAYLMTAHKADTERAASKMLDYAEKQKLHPLGIVLVTELAVGGKTDPESVKLVRDIISAENAEARETLKTAKDFHYVAFMMATDHPRDKDLMALH